MENIFVDMKKSFSQNKINEFVNSKKLKLISNHTSKKKKKKKKRRKTQKTKQITTTKNFSFLNK